MASWFSDILGSNVQQGLQNFGSLVPCIWMNVEPNLQHCKILLIKGGHPVGQQT